MNRQQILERAIEIVSHDRSKEYGEPEDNFHAIAQLWNAYLKINRYEMELGNIDVALMMALMKMARIVSNCEHTDSWIDAAGYIACGGGIATQ